MENNVHNLSSNEVVEIKASLAKMEQTLENINSLTNKVANVDKAIENIPYQMELSIMQAMNEVKDSVRKDYLDEMSLIKEELKLVQTQLNLEKERVNKLQLEQAEEKKKVELLMWLTTGFGATILANIANSIWKIFK